MPNTLDEVVCRSLTAFASESLAGDWSGRREREAVSLYAFGHLLREIDGDGFLRYPTQIGIEVPVPQVQRAEVVVPKGSGRSKEQVCKDIVLWPEPAMTCWDASGNPTVPPAAILEWKFDVSAVHEPDVEWLKAFSRIYSGFIGYAIAANRRGAGFLLQCVRIIDGVENRDWLRL